MGTHLRHHKHTNDAALDPDKTPFANGLLHVLAAPPCYVAYFVRNRGSMSSRDLRDTFLFLGVSLASLAGGTLAGCGGYILQFAVWPMLLALMWLSFAFSYLPHYPFDVSRDEDLYGCTGVVDGVWSVGSGYSTRFLTWLLLWQNYHAIHHIYPTVPFYTYEKLWKRNKDAFVRAGVPLITLAGH